MKKLLEKYKLNLAGIIGTLGFLLMCNDPELGVENYEFALSGFWLNGLGIIMLGCAAYVAHLDYENNPEKWNEKEL